MLLNKQKTTRQAQDYGNVGEVRSDVGGVHTAYWVHVNIASNGTTTTPHDPGLRV